MSVGLSVLVLLLPVEGGVDGSTIVGAGTFGVVVVVVVDGLLFVSVEVELDGVVVAAGAVAGAGVVVAGVLVLLSVAALLAGVSTFAGAEVSAAGAGVAAGPVAAAGRAAVVLRRGVAAAFGAAGTGARVAATAAATSAVAGPAQPVCWRPAVVRTAVIGKRSPDMESLHSLPRTFSTKGRPPRTPMNSTPSAKVMRSTRTADPR